MITQDTMDAAEKAFGVQGQHIDIHKLDPTHKKILLICEDCPESVNDRPLLMAKFYENDWDAGKSLYDNFKHLIRPETVVRRFRDLREWGYVKQSEKADKYNYDAMISERDKHSTSPTVKIVKGEKVVNIAEEYIEERNNERLEALTKKVYEQGSLL